MGAYELIKGEENGVYDAKSGYRKMEEEGLTRKQDLESGTTMNHVQPRDALVTKGESTSRRLVSLDVFRGITVALMILVDHAGGIFPAINHSPWNGVTLADFVMPFFLFIVGVSLGLTYKRLSNNALATKKAIVRAVKLLALGLILQGGYIHRVFDLSYGVDIARIRWMGVLQRIAIAYLVAAICEIWLKDKQDVISGFSLLKKYLLQWLLALMISIINMVLLYVLYVPDWEFQILIDGASPTMKTYSVKCGVRGDTGPACNAVGMIDRTILGINHLYTRPTYKRSKECSMLSPDYGPLPPNAPSWCHAPFDPEGLLSSVMAIVTCIIGLHFGHVLVHFKDHKERILQWMIPSLGFVLLGFSMDFSGMYLNKALYSFSYMCVTAGVAGIAFTGIYVMVDVYNYRRSTKLAEWMGVNALTIYILVACNIVPIVLQGFYWKSPENNVVSLCLLVAVSLRTAVPQEDWGRKIDWQERTIVTSSRKDGFCFSTA